MNDKTFQENAAHKLKVRPYSIRNSLTSLETHVEFLQNSSLLKSGTVFGEEF